MLVKVSSHLKQAAHSYPPPPPVQAAAKVLEERKPHLMQFRQAGV